MNSSRVIKRLAARLLSASVMMSVGMGFLPIVRRRVCVRAHTRCVVLGVGQVRWRPGRWKIPCEGRTSTDPAHLSFVWL